MKGLASDFSLLKGGYTGRNQCSTHKEKRQYIYTNFKRNAY